MVVSPVMPSPESSIAERKNDSLYSNFWRVLQEGLLADFALVTQINEVQIDIVLHKNLVTVAIDQNLVVMFNVPRSEPLNDVWSSIGLIRARISLRVCGSCE